MTAPALVLLRLLLYFAVWSRVFDVRNKDVRFVAPLIDALVAVPLVDVGGRLRRAVMPRVSAWT